MNMTPTSTTLGARQLNAICTVTVMENNERVELEIYRVANIVVVAPTDRIDDEPRAKKRKPGEDRKWEDGDLTDAPKMNYRWTGPKEGDEYKHVDLSPEKLFKLFFDEELCNHIIVKSVRYVPLEGNIIPPWISQHSGDSW